MTTYAQKWKTTEIYKRKSAGRLHTEKKHQVYGAPPPKGDCWSGHNPPILSTNINVTRETTNMLRKNIIETNATPFRRSRDHNHIGLLMKGNLNCHLSCQHLARIKITCAGQVWQFITELIKPYKNMHEEVAL